MMIIGRIFEDTLTGLPAYNINSTKNSKQSSGSAGVPIIRKLLKPGVAISYTLWNILTLVSLAVSMLLISMRIAVKMDGKLGRDLYRNNWSLTSISFLSKGKNDFI